MCTESGLGDCAFMVAAARAWSNLPFDLCMAASVDCFINKLKPFLFNTAFTSQCYFNSFYPVCTVSVRHPCAFMCLRHLNLDF